MMTDDDNDADANDDDVTGVGGIRRQPAKLTLITNLPKQTPKTGARNSSASARWTRDLA